MYDFQTLSPIDFEELVRDLLQAALHIRLESFGIGRDQGIDFRFAQGTHNLIVQAKHYSRTGPSGLISAAKAEDPKIAILNPTRYIFVTSVSLTPSLKGSIIKALPSAPLAAEDVLGLEDLNNLLALHSDVERKHFKLWLSSTSVLERILHSDIYNRTQAELDIIKQAVPKIVQNPSIPAAEKILEETGALIIAGQPGVGKTTLARLLVWLHMEQDWTIQVIDDIDQFFQITGDGKKRLVFFDDFLGQIRLSSEQIRTIDRRLPPILDLVRDRRDLRFILTTRDYILRQAQSVSSRLDGPAINIRKFILNVGHFTRAVRAKILYNHIFFSRLPDSEITSLLDSDFYLQIIDHENYSPRLIELLTSADYLSLAGMPIREAVLSVLNNPYELWEKPYRHHIRPEARALMLAMFFNAAEVPISRLERSFTHFSAALELQIPRADLAAVFRAALRELEGSVVAIQNRRASFANPGIRDFLECAIARDRFLGAALGVATDYDEVRQVWKMFEALEPRDRGGLVGPEDWCHALRRMFEEGLGSDISKIALGFQIADALDGELPLSVLEDMAAELEQVDIAEYNLSEAASLLEQLYAIADRSPAHAKAHEYAFLRLSQMVRESGYLLDIDNLSSASNALTLYGVDSTEAEEVACTAIEGYVLKLNDVLSSLTETYQVDEIEEKLGDLMSTYGIYFSNVDETFAEYRTYLEESYEEPDYDYTMQRGREGSAEMSDAEIRGMFVGLLRR